MEKMLRMTTTCAMPAGNSKSTPNAYEINVKDYDDAQEVSLGEFDAIHANKYQELTSLYQQLWNNVGPPINSMMVQLTLIKDSLEDDEAGMPFEWLGASKELCLFLDKEAKGGVSNQLKYINDMMAEMYQLNPTGVRNFNLLNEELDKEQNASKTQGTPPRAHKARPAK
jgi:hypothetical protein